MTLPIKLLVILGILILKQSFKTLKSIEKSSLKKDTFLGKNNNKIKVENISEIIFERIKNKRRYLEDKKLISFFEKEIKYHNEVKKELLCMLEVKSNE